MGIGGTMDQWTQYQRPPGTQAARSAEVASNGQILDASPVFSSHRTVRQELGRSPQMTTPINPMLIRNKRIEEMNMAGAGVRPGMRLGQNAVQAARAGRGLGGSMVNMPPGMMNNPRFAALGPYGQGQPQGGPPQAPPGPPPAPMGPPPAPPLPDQVQTQSRLAALAR